MTLRRFFAILAAAPLAGACVLGHTPISAQAPEARPKEAIPPRPPECQGASARCAFRPGYWTWTGSTYVWVPGRWEAGDGLDLVSSSDS